MYVSSLPLRTIQMSKRMHIICCNAFMTCARCGYIVVMCVSCMHDDDCSVASHYTMCIVGHVPLNIYIVTLVIQATDSVCQYNAAR